MKKTKKKTNQEPWETSVNTNKHKKRLLLNFTLGGLEKHRGNFSNRTIYFDLFCVISSI